MSLHVQSRNVLITLLFWCCLATAYDARGEFEVRGISYIVIPRVSAIYFGPSANSSITCYESGIDPGQWAIMRAGCAKVDSLPANLPPVYHAVEVYNLVEADGQFYTISCRDTKLGGKCNSLAPGQTFSAERRGWKMWVTARTSRSDGKEVRSQYDLLDVRPEMSTETQISLSSNLSVTGSYSGMVRNITLGVPAHFGIAIRQQGDAITGCIGIQEPLYGSGLLQGAMHGTQVIFDSASTVFSIRFQGEWKNGELIGPYVVVSPNRQDGVFTLRKESTDAPLDGFNLKECLKKLAIP